MLQVVTTNKFESDVRKMVRNGKEANLLWDLVDILISEEVIPEEYRDHELTGRWSGVRDIHIEADWLLLYKRINRELILLRTGTHQDLF